VSEQVLVDVGPMVASLVRADRNSRWARDQFARLRPFLMSPE
jgi:hypothetical protein